MVGLGGQGVCCMTWATWLYIKFWLYISLMISCLSPCGDRYRFWSSIESPPSFILWDWESLYVLTIGKLIMSVGLSLACVSLFSFSQMSGRTNKAPKFIILKKLILKLFLFRNSIFIFILKIVKIFCLF